MSHAQTDLVDGYLALQLNIMIMNSSFNITLLPPKKMQQIASLAITNFKIPEELTGKRLTPQSQLPLVCRLTKLS